MTENKQSPAITRTQASRIKAIAQSGDSAAVIAKRVNLVAALGGYGDSKAPGALSVRDIASAVARARVEAAHPGAAETFISAILADNVKVAPYTEGLKRANIGFYSRGYGLAIQAGIVVAGDTLPQAQAVAAFRVAYQGTRVNTDTLTAAVKATVEGDGIEKGREEFLDLADSATASAKGEQKKASPKKVTLTPADAFLKAVETAKGQTFSKVQAAAILKALDPFTIHLTALCQVKNDKVHPGKKSTPSVRRAKSVQVKSLAHA